MKFAEALRRLKEDAQSPRRSALAGRDDFVAGLDVSEEQRAAICASTEKNVVVRAGAGSGKTKVLTSRLAYLSKSGVTPEKIMLCTFTRAAGLEMRHRVSQIDEILAANAVISTIHAAAYKELQQTFFQDHESFDRVLVEDDELLEHLKRFVESGEPAAKAKVAVDLLVDLPQFYLELCRIRESFDFEASMEVGEPELLVELWNTFMEESYFRDLTWVLQKTMMTEGTPRQQYAHVLVDEAQDLTLLQSYWVERHLAPGGCIFAVGDDCQSIYGFRGTEEKVLTQLAEKFEADVFTLSANYRSGAAIVAVANTLSAPMGKGAVEMKAMNTWDAGSVVLNEFSDDTDEADWIAKYGQIYQEDEVAVLVRTNRQAEALAIRLGWPINPKRNQVEGVLRGVFTIHATKGLQFDRVVVSGCEEAVLPLPYGHLPEEYRLFYVAVTRAKRAVELCSAVTRNDLNRPSLKPSRFLAILDKHLSKRPA